MSVDPLSLSATLDFGETDVQTIELTNEGATGTPFELTERDRGWTPAVQIQRFSGELVKSGVPVSAGRAPNAATGFGSTGPFFKLPNGAPAYAFNVYPGGSLVLMDTEVPNPWTEIGPLFDPFVDFFPGGDFLNGDFSTEYAVSYYGNELLAINTADATYTVIGSAAPSGGETWTGLAGSPDGTLFASGSSCGSSSTLYTIDPDTAEVTAIGNVSNAPCLIDIAANADGELYGVDIVNDTLVQIDPATGVGTVIGSTGFDANYAQGMDFDEDTGILYWAAYGFSGELRVIDTSTGASASVGAFPDGAEVDGLGLATGGAADAPWLSEDPATGYLNPDGGIQTVDVTFDAYVVTQPGEYYADLKVKTDDPINGTIAVPVTMTVVPPDDWGKLTGVVSSLGYCDQNPSPLEDASVVVEISGMPYTVTTGVDGAYTVWGPQGTITYTVSAEGHVGDSGTAEIVAGEITTLDLELRWIAPCISGMDTSYDVEVPWHFSLDFPFEVLNTGAGAAEFELSDRAVKEITVSGGVFAAPQALVPEAQQQAKNTQGLDLPELPVVAPLDAGEVFQTWYPTENNFAWGIAYDGDDETVWVGDWTNQNTIFEYETDGTITGRSHQYDWSPWAGPADSAFNWNTGMLWTLDVGLDNCIHEMDVAGGYTGNTICGPWYYDQRGLAYDPATDTWFVGSWNDYTIYHIDSAGNLLDSAYVGLPISGLAYNPDTLHLFVMVNYYDEPVYVLDVANNYANVGQFYIDGWPGYWNGAGLEIDCEGNLWAVAQSEQKVYELDSGETASVCRGGKDAPWLTEDPQAGSLLADDTFPVELTFTAFPSMSIGTYYTGTLLIKSTDPVSDTFTVPVTLTVIQPEIEMSLAPTMTAVSSPPGSTVQYRLTIQNNGNVPDTYDLSLQDDDWPTLMLTQQVSLDPGESAEILIFVFIPASAGDGEIDDFRVLAESSSDEVIGLDVSASADLSTRAFYTRIVRLTPATASMLGDVGEVMEYTLTLWNLSVVSDTIELHGEAGWEMDMSETRFTLDSFESAEVTVQVHIPWGAVPGELDTAMITATSQSDPGAWDETRLTTHAGEMHLFLPMVVKEP
jgi:hypothetical protein